MGKRVAAGVWVVGVAVFKGVSAGVWIVGVTVLTGVTTGVSSLLLVVGDDWVGTDVVSSGWFG